MEAGEEQNTTVIAQIEHQQQQYVHRGAAVHRDNYQRKFSGDSLTAYPVSTNNWRPR